MDGEERERENVEEVGGEKRLKGRVEMKVNGEVEGEWKMGRQGIKVRGNGWGEAEVRSRGRRLRGWVPAILKF